MGGESNGRLLRNTECFAVGYSSWRCSIPEVAGRHNQHYHRLQVLPVMSHARAYCAVATHDNVVYVLGGFEAEVRRDLSLSVYWEDSVIGIHLLLSRS